MKGIAEIKISTKFHKYRNKWTGLKIQMGVKGTHENYNVIYNGECCNEYFNTEEEAKHKATEAGLYESLKWAEEG